MTATKSKILSVIGIALLGSVFLTFQNCSPVSFRTVSSQQANATGPETVFTCTPGEVEECELNGMPGTRTCVDSPRGPEWGACIVDPGEPPGPPTYASCTFKGVTYVHGQSFVAYLTETVSFGSTCSSQVRTCINGSITGTYQYLTCVEEENGDCTIGGQTVKNGESITTYLTASVPYGQTCQSQTRMCKDKVLSGSYTFLSCVVDPVRACTFNGQTVAHNGTVTAYQASTVPFGSTCVSENRMCNNGILSGSYAASSCTVQPPATCSFNGQTVAHNGTVTAFQAGTVPFGSTCSSEVRKCTNGTLSGTYTVASCSVAPPATCSFNGQTVAHDGTVTAFQTSTVPFGSTCSSEVRKCTNGNLSGTYTVASCSVAPPATCSFNGQTVAHNASVTAYPTATVPFGSTCQPQTRTCTNGTLSGTYTIPSCTVQPPATCSFNGQTVAHNASVTAYQTTSVPFGSMCSSEVRTCTNGTLSGTYANSSCSVAPPATCSFNGQTVAHNASVMAYQTANVPFGSTCSSQTRICTNGVLSGSYTFNSCSVDTAATCVFNGKTIAHGTTVKAYATGNVPFGQTCISEDRTCTNGTLSGSYSSASCSVLPPANCSLNGQTVNHGSSLITYATNSVAFGQTCESQTRVCTNGVLSGTYSSLNCTVLPPANCSLNGQAVNHGTSVTTYPASSVPFGQVCQPQVRTCTNGTLSGTNSITSCTVLPPANCSLNGQPVNHSASVTAYASSSVPFGQTCQAETRTCTNGTLSGSFSSTACSVTPPANCSLNGQAVNHGTSVTTYAASSVPFGQTCQSQTRTCSNGVLSGSYSAGSCSVQPPANCSLNGQPVNHGASVTAYTTSSVPFGQTCQTQTRTCSNGVLSGEAAFSSCTPLPPANCAFNGQAVAHGETVKGYQMTSVTEPATCSSENRTCTNGVLSGSFAYPSCTVKVNLNCRAYMYSACKKTSGSSKIACGYASPHGLHPEYVCSGKVIAGGYNTDSGQWIGVGDISISAPWTTVPTLGNYPNARCVVHYKVGYSTPASAHGISSVYYDGDPQPNALTTGKVNSLGEPLIKKVGCDND